MNPLTRREALQMGGIAAGGLTLAGPVRARTVATGRSVDGEREPTGTHGDGDTTVESVAEDAYIYGLQQVVFYETRYNYTQKEDSDVFVGVNRWYRPNGGRPITADFTAVVAPNATTLYAHAFLDLQDEPVVIEMPEVTDRYFSLQMMDQYGIYPLYAGNQFNGTKARSYLILPDGYDGEIPGEFVATDVVQAPTKSLFAFVRYGLRDASDESEIAFVNGLQEQTTITPLSEWLANDDAGVPQTERPVVAGDYATFPRMAELTTQLVDRQTAADFFTLLGLVLNDPSLPRLDDSGEEAAMLERLKDVGIGPEMPFDWAGLDRDVQAELTSGFETGFERVRRAGLEGMVDMNGWQVFDSTADFRTDWETRAVLADIGYAGPDSPASHVAGFRFTDATGEQLDGSKRYTITFDLDDLPPVTEFWSIPIYDARGYFVDNELDRYTINSYMLEAGALHTEGDELVIYVQNERPDDPEQAKNWLPAPEGGMRFAARFYGPYWSLVDGSYDMPDVVAVGGASR